MFSAVSELFIKIPQEIPEKSNGFKNIIRSFKNDLVEGFRYVWKNKGLRNLVILCAVYDFFVIPIIVLLPFYVEDFLSLKAEWYGFLMAALGLGSLIGFAIAGVLKLSGRGRYFLLVWMFILFSIAFGSLGFYKIPNLVLFIFFAAGVMGGIFDIIAITLVQLTTPANLRGRVFGVISTMHQSLFPISAALSGIIADLTGQNLPLIYGTCGVFMLVISLSIIADKEMYRFLSFEKKQ
ncbi:MFS transporter [candidate division KSB1 bacterium]